MATPSEYGIVEVTALLTYDQGTNKLGWQEGMRVASLAEYVIAPGIRGWALTLDPVVSVTPAVGTLVWLATSIAFGKYDARLLLVNLGGSPTVVYIVDTTTGLPVDPATVQALAPAEFFGVQLHAVTAGTTQGVAP